MGSRARGEIWLEVAAWRGERSQTTAQRAMRTVVVRERARLLVTGEPRGRPGRPGEVERDGVVPVRGGLLLIIGRLWAVDSGRGV
jgi:hypothetical protein